MKLSFVLSLLLIPFCSSLAQKSILMELLSHPVGGTWVSTNTHNKGNPEDFSSFYMNFGFGMTKESVWGRISGVRNSGDTVKLIELWNFMNEPEKNILLVQRTTWGEVSIGSIVPYENDHLDIQFKSATASGQEYYVRDIHYLIGADSMQSVSYQKRLESDEWQKTRISEWKRITEDE